MLLKIYERKILYEIEHRSEQRNRKLSLFSTQNFKAEEIMNTEETIMVCQIYERKSFYEIVQEVNNAAR